MRRREWSHPKMGCTDPRISCLLYPRWGALDGEQVQEVVGSAARQGAYLQKPAQAQLAFGAGPCAGSRDHGLRSAAETCHNKGAPAARAISCGVRQGGSAASLRQIRTWGIRQTMIAQNAFAVAYATGTAVMWVILWISASSDSRSHLARLGNALLWPLFFIAGLLAILKLIVCKLLRLDP